MSKDTAPTWGFENSKGRVITTSNVADAEKYRQDPRFTEVTDTTVEQVDDTGHVKAYDDPSWTKTKLQAEIDARNDAAGDEDAQIVVDEPGNKPELIAALTADDAARADAVTV